MKTIYMQQTLQLMSNGRYREVEELIASGKIKQIEQGSNYLVITTEDEDRASGDL